MQPGAEKLTKHAFPITVAVLAGGASRRMGRDKALLRSEGRCWAAIVCEAGLAAGFSTFLVGRNAFPFGFIPNGVHFIPDDAPGAGPLAALATALRSLPSGGDILLAPCDVPRIKPDDLLWLARAHHLHRTASGHKGSSFLGTVALAENVPQPLFAVYRPNCLPLIEELLASGRRRLLDLLETGQFRFAMLPDTHKTAIADIDTPSELYNL